MSRILYTLVALVLAAVAAIVVLQFVVGFLGTILQVGIAGVLVLVIASGVVRAARHIGRLKKPDSASQVIPPSKEVQHTVIEKDW